MMLGLALGAAMAAAPSIDSPPITGLSAPNDFAVVIANEDYTGFGHVTYATRDADAFAAWLTRTRGLKSVNVAHYYNESADGIAAAVADGAARVGAGGTLWLYYAGHGLGLKPDGSPAPQQMLLGINAMAKANELPKYVVPLADLQKVAGGSKASHAVFLLDACFNNAGRDGAPLVDGRFAVPVGQVAATSRVTVWSATDVNETALPYEPAQHGAFTYFAVGALSGWADGVSGPADGQVTLDEASEWVGRAMNAHGVRGQTPRIAGEAAVVAVSARGKLAPEPTEFPRPDEKAPAVATTEATAAPRPATPAPVTATDPLLPNPFALAMPIVDGGFGIANAIVDAVPVTTRVSIFWKGKGHKGAVTVDGATTCTLPCFATLSVGEHRFVLADGTVITRDVSADTTRVELP
jgi:hypothetical protein